MDGNAQNEVAQGNSMLSDMREHNREVLRHNLATKTNFNTQILQATKTARDEASQKKAETAGEGLGEGGAQALKLARQGVKAYGEVQKGIGYQGMGRAEVAGRTALGVLKEAPIGQAVSKTAGAVSDVAEAAKPAVALAGVAARNVASAVASRAALAPSLEESTARTLDPHMTRQFTAEAGDAPTSVGTIAGPKASALTDTPAARLAGADAPVGPKISLKTAPAADAEGGFAKGLDMVEKGGALLNIATGGMDAIEDAVAGHVMGHNKDSKAGNELGIAGGVASLAGFAIPGLGLIGAGLGIASGIESMIGSQEHSKKEISTTLPAQEKAEEEKTVSYSGATGESAGQVTQTQTQATAKTGGAGASAF
jgi:hypothetical protein